MLVRSLSLLRTDSYTTPSMPIVSKSTTLLRKTLCFIATAPCSMLTWNLAVSGVPNRVSTLQSHHMTKFGFKNQVASLRYEVFSYI
jgi:hypothetical protein